MFKLAVLALLVAVVKAGVIAPHGYVGHSAATSHSTITQHAGPVAYGAPYAKYAAAPLTYAHAAPIAKHVVAEPYAAPNYDFAYSVHDPHTGDVKEQHEQRHEDAVQGSYSLIEADGSRRVVHYTADDHNGFNAVVQREPAHVKAVAAAPVLAKYAPAPLHYAAAPAAIHHVNHHY